MTKTFRTLDDADLNIAVECAANGAFYQTGQRCRILDEGQTASERAPTILDRTMLH